MTNVYVDRMAPAFSEGKYRFGKHPTLLEESAQAAREDGADVVVAVTEIGLPWMVQAAKDCASVDVMFSARPTSTPTIRSSSRRPKPWSSSPGWVRRSAVWTSAFGTGRYSSVTTSTV